MARHIMAVCVVCLLCADRMPCEQHIDEGGVYPANVEYQTLNAKVIQRLENGPVKMMNAQENIENPGHNFNINIDDSHNNNDNNDKQIQEHTSELNGKQHAQLRRKRHAGGHHSHDDPETDERPEITQEFLQRFFNENGQGDDGTLTIAEFRNILAQLGLHRLVQTKLDIQSNISNNCIADINLVKRVQKMDSNHHDHHNDHDHNHKHSSSSSSSSSSSTSCEMEPNMKDSTNCSKQNPSSRENMTAHCPPDFDKELTQNYSLKKEDILNLCPVLLYQLTSTSNSMREGCIENEILLEIDERAHKKLHSGKEDLIYVWTYAFFSVFACGILGLVGVAIIPFMDSRYYKHIIQYLVSLAVGTMTGDALLHLLPHSLAGQTENNMIYKGLTCMGGIIFFYITEHGLTMISEWRKRKAKKDSNPARAKVVRDPESSITNSVAGDKLCKSKYSSYPYCYDEIAMDTKNDVWMHMPNNAADNRDLSIGSATGAERKRNGRSEANANELTAAQSLLSTSQNSYAPMTDINNYRHQHQHPHHKSNRGSLFEGEPDYHSGGDGCVVGVGASGNGASSVTPDEKVNNAKDKDKDKDKDKNDTVTVILREHESSHHGHSHKHGHVHSPPESLSAVAWMIIMGDGLHNFTDGMAIGAAFAENIAGGFSTSLAVFCHELPHELGDFAILIKAGMSVKSAVYYNLLTGVLSFIGMIFGIVFGQSQSAAQWMFAAAAGLFIYIALVDMMPELSAAHKSLEQLALQIFGMSTGVFLMLLIAIFEGDLMTIFASSTTTTTTTTTTSSMGSSSLKSFEPASGN